MTLLLPLTADEWGDDEYAAVGALFGMPGDDVPRAGSGDARDPMNFDILGVLARHPAMAREFLTYNAFLLQRGELPLRLRELAVLRLAHARRSVFFWGEHVKSRQGRRPHGRGRRRYRRTAMTDSTASTGWSSRRPTNCSPTVVRNRRRGNDSSRSLGTHQAMELIFVVGTYAMLAMACDTWALVPPPGSAQLPEPRTDR